MPLFEAVIWEQRRVSIRVEASDAAEAEDLAREFWEDTSDADLESHGATWIDNQEIKAAVTEPLDDDRARWVREDDLPVLRAADVRPDAA